MILELSAAVKLKATQEDLDSSAQGCVQVSALRYATETVDIGILESEGSVGVD